MGSWNERSTPRPQRLQTEFLRAAYTAQERMTLIRSCRRASPKRACLPQRVEM